MCDDISKNMMNAFGLQDVSKYQDQLRNSLLYELEKLFAASNSSLSKHHLPQPNKLMMDRITNRSLREELDYNVDSLKHEHSNLFRLLNKEQKYVYDSVIQTIHNNRSGLFFVHGHGGTGKTFLWTTIMARIRSQNQIVLAVASSGIASLLLPGGRTAHSRFKIPINITDCSVCEIKKGTHLAKLISEAALIIWDEAPMNHKRCFETLDRSLRDVLKGSKPGFDHLPFGGKPILFGGDFRQILPVVPNGSVADIVEASLTSSYLWPYLTKFCLKQNMRLSKPSLDERKKQELTHFAKWILDIGNNIATNSLPSTNEESSWRSSKVVPHAAIIELNRKTSQELPMHWFNLIELNQLHQRIDNDVELTDVFGCLTAVQPTEEITIQNTRVAKKRNLNLQNIRDETVRITLWGETATGFETSGIQALLPPVFCAFTSLKVKQYQGKPVLGINRQPFFNNFFVYISSINLSHPKHAQNRFKHSRSPLQILPTSAEMYTGRAVSATTESKTIDELLLLDPALHKNASFVCQATIVEFDLTKGWWYKSCPSCHKVVKKNSESFECNEHGFINRLPEPWFKIDLIVEDSTNQHNFLMIGRHAEKILRVSCHTLVIEDGHEDPFILPPALKNLTDFIVHGLLQDQPLSSPTIALVTPKTPTPSVGIHVMTQATPSPVMPSHRPNQQPQLVAPTKTSKRALIAKEFHNLVVPKIEPADKVPIATLRTKSQTKKTKDSAEDVHSQKKLTPQSP
ncbi:hypothetical protein D8674_038810 [Pyrus ussuriensis x Pyrus communis]|uniref:ATP-dependent DNA helicase n=1 Tax=Pyrus ussuriensis x Pyrus communis TaxID=2448454 RepID=A0A5N5H7F7_9ROSA|nr:hypothetical protein D8674_038810 [Pyrus ussuriensis x Pyrus communis]